MGRLRLVIIEFLMLASLVSLPASVEAAWLDLSPTSVDFGVVNLGETATTSLLIQNTNGYPTEIWLYLVCIAQGSTFDCASGPGPFTAVSDLLLPRVISVGESVSVTLTFTPSGLGPTAGYVVVMSNDEQGSLRRVPLSGTGGTAVVPEPSSMVLLLSGLAYSARRQRRPR